MNCAIQVHYLLLCFIFCAPSKAGKLTSPSTHAWACRVYKKGARVQGTFWVSALARPPVSHIIKIERGARRHLIPILAASCGCAAARGRQAKQKGGEGGGHTTRSRSGGWQSRAQTKLTADNNSLEAFINMPNMFCYHQMENASFSRTTGPRRSWRRS